MQVKANNPGKTKLVIAVRDIESDIAIVTYDDVVRYHEGDSWFGCAAGFMAMQKAAQILSADHVLDRDNLYILSGHPGSGVRDAIEVVTQCISHHRYRLLDDNNVYGCNRDMRFEWWVSNGHHTAHVRISDGIVPDKYFELAERELDEQRNDHDRHAFARLKSTLRNTLLSLSLNKCFSGELLDKPLSPVGRSDA